MPPTLRISHLCSVLGLMSILSLETVHAVTHSQLPLTGDEVVALDNGQPSPATVKVVLKEVDTVAPPEAGATDLSMARLFDRTRMDLKGIALYEGTNRALAALDREIALSKFVFATPLNPQPRPGVLDASRRTIEVGFKHKFTNEMGMPRLVYGATVSWQDPTMPGKVLMRDFSFSIPVDDNYFDAINDAADEIGDFLRFKKEELETLPPSPFEFAGYPTEEQGLTPLMISGDVIDSGSPVFATTSGTISLAFGQNEDDPGKATVVVQPAIVNPNMTVTPDAGIVINPLDELSIRFDGEIVGLTAEFLASGIPLEFRSVMNDGGTVVTFDVPDLVEVGFLNDAFAFRFTFDPSTSLLPHLGVGQGDFEDLIHGIDVTTGPFAGPGIPLSLRIGTNPAGGLPIPEPANATLGLLSIGGLMLRRRRMA